MIDASSSWKMEFQNYRHSNTFDWLYTITTMRPVLIAIGISMTTQYPVSGERGCVFVLNEVVIFFRHRLFSAGVEHNINGIPFAYSPSQNNLLALTQLINMAL